MEPYYPLVQEEYGLSAKDLQLGSVADLEMIGTIISQGLHIVEMITAKVDHADERSYAFIGLWERHYAKKNLVMKKSFDSFMARMMGINYSEFDH